MAAAYVSGAAGLVLSVDDLSAVELKDRLIRSGDMYYHLMNKTIDGRSLNITRALLGEENLYIEYIYCEDDYDVHGYQPTASELYELYSSSDVVQLAGGHLHTLVLKTDGTVWSWGYNSNGECGNGTNTYAETLVQVVGLNNVTAVSAGTSHSLALKSDGTVWAWGDNSKGNLLP
jgi:alpha-tubulin suppressor-like RCC1 family protein